jgi:hypothetical protein
MLDILERGEYPDACRDSCNTLDWKWLPLVLVPELVLAVGATVAVGLGRMTSLSRWRLWTWTLALGIVAALALPVFTGVTNGMLVRGIPRWFLDLTS